MTVGGSSSFVCWKVVGDGLRVPEGWPDQNGKLNCNILKY